MISNKIWSIRTKYFHLGWKDKQKHFFRKDSIIEIQINLIFLSSTTNAEYQDKEKLVIAEECELVTLVEVIKGRLEVTTTHVYFFDCSGMKEEGKVLLFTVLTEYILTDISEQMV